MRERFPAGCRGERRADVADSGARAGGGDEREAGAPLRLRVVYPGAMTLYLGALAARRELRPEHALVAGLVACCYGPPATRRFVDGLMPVIATGLVYDARRLIEPVLQRVPVHIAGAYALEKRLFGIHQSSTAITPNEYFLRHHADWLDVLTALPYLTYIGEAAAFAVYLYATDPERCRRFGRTFFAVNLVGMATESLLPTAPPWYVQEHGLGPAVRDVPPSPAGALRFDALTGTRFFATLYSRATEVFGAIPSLHVSYPLLVYLYARELRQPILEASALGFTLLMSFAAVYLQHHYVIDVVAGAAYALAGYAIERIVTGRRARRRGGLLGRLLAAVV